MLTRSGTLSWKVIKRYGLINSGLSSKNLFRLNNNRYFSNYTKPKQNNIFKWFKRIGLSFCGSICILGGWLYYNHYDEENWRRSLYFWGNLYPIYVHYRLIDFMTKKSKEKDRNDAFEKLHNKYKYKIYNIAIDLQGFYLKLGQLGAARTDIIPIQWVELLRKLQDECPYQSFDIIQDIVKKDFNINDISQIFQYIDPKPLGSASIGQTHYARLKNGKEVVIKVQYRDVEKLFRGDFKMARKFCEMAQPAHLPFLDETEKQFLTEFDYVLEAKNLQEIGDNINDNPLWKDKIIIPKPYHNLCTKHVLTMEYLTGKKLITALKENFTALANERGLKLEEFIEQQKKLNFHPTSEEMKKIHRQIIIRDYLWNGLAIICNYSFGFLFKLLGNDDIHFIKYKKSVLPLNTKLILDLVSDIHAYEIFIDGAFNGDPHPGNILICDDGKLGLIDYGQVKHLTIKQRIELAKLMIFLGDNNKDMIIKQMNDRMGFQTKYGDKWVIEKSARFYFDADDESVTEGMNVQLFLEYLNHRDPVKHLSDDYVMVGRLKILISGLFHSLGYKFKASQLWRKYAENLLNKHDVDPYNH